MKTASDMVTLERRGPIARLVLNRPDAGNAMSGAGLLLLAARLRECALDTGVRAIVIRGAGNRFFCTGSDIAELAGGLPDIGVHLRKWHTVVDLVESSEKPVIAAINGAAVGGGLELALACQHRIAVASARVGLPELKVGLFPAAGGVRRLTRLIGSARALDLVLSTDLIDAEAAEQLGILDQVFPEAEFDAAVDDVAKRMAKLEPNAVRATLMCARAAALGNDTNDLEITLLRECYANPRNREVLAGFMSRPRSRAGKTRK